MLLTGAASHATLLYHRWSAAASPPISQSTVHLARRPTHAAPVEQPPLDLCPLVPEGGGRERGRDNRTWPNRTPSRRGLRATSQQRNLDPVPVLVFWSLVFSPWDEARRGGAIWVLRSCGPSHRREVAILLYTMTGPVTTRSLACLWAAAEPQILCGLPDHAQGGRAWLLHDNAFRMTLAEATAPSTELREPTQKGGARKQSVHGDQGKVRARWRIGNLSLQSGSARLYL